MGDSGFTRLMGRSAYTDVIATFIAFYPMTEQHTDVIFTPPPNPNDGVHVTDVRQAVTEHRAKYERYAHRHRCACARLNIHQLIEIW